MQTSAAVVDQSKLLARLYLELVIKKSYSKRANAEIKSDQ
jgi:hypothetical protein